MRENHMARIPATIGRVLEFMPVGEAMSGMVVRDQPLDAHVAFVHPAKEGEPDFVNLMVVDADGHPHSRTHVRLVQAGEEPPVDRSYCRWMVYQQGQAAKTEDVAGKLAKRLEELELAVARLTDRVLAASPQPIAEPPFVAPSNLPPTTFTPGPGVVTQEPSNAGAGSLTGTVSTSGLTPGQ
jgi:hypothetical protein